MSSPHDDPKEMLLAQVRKQRALYLRKSVEEKADHPHCRWSLSDVVTTGSLKEESLAHINLRRGRREPSEAQGDDSMQGTRVTLWQGDITSLAVDAIVNAANSSLAGGGGVDGAIHAAAGWELLKRECRMVHGHCDTGDAKLTAGYLLPAKYVIHAVGPQCYRGYVDDTKRSQLSSCYRSCLDIIREHNRSVHGTSPKTDDTESEKCNDSAIRSIAFPCISTGIYGYPPRDAAQTALEAACDWLMKNPGEMDHVIFCVYLDSDRNIYEELFQELNEPQMLDVSLLSKLVHILESDQSALLKRLSLSEDEVQSCPPGLEKGSPLAALVCWNKKLVDDGCGAFECLAKLTDTLELKEKTIESLLSAALVHSNEEPQSVWLNSDTLELQEKTIESLLSEFRKPGILDIYTLAELCRSLEESDPHQATLLERLELSGEEVKQACPDGIEESSGLAILVCWNKKVVKDQGWSTEKCQQKLQDIIRKAETVKPPSSNGDET